jgi:hypothetical protein
MVERFANLLLGTSAFAQSNPAPQDQALQHAIACPSGIPKQDD